eukprot:m.187158 g.187158  ORF g.187158 m.187158 type:complete len:223 (+) comp18499_c0_seq1:262-930(+)
MFSTICKEQICGSRNITVGFSASNIRRSFISCPQQRRASCTSIYTQGEELDKKRRCYFYFVDHNGYVFLDDVRMRNFTSCYKDPEFLQFFYRRLRASRPTDPAFDRYGKQFPWVSPCGREINYIRCDDTPIVYDSLQKEQEDGENWLLCYAGGRITTKFDPGQLTFSKTTGRMYYPHDTIGNALVASQLVLKLAKEIEEDDVDENSVSIVWQGDRVVLHTVP